VAGALPKKRGLCEFWPEVNIFDLFDHHEYPGNWEICFGLTMKIVL
jgi:hypothetical protein